MTVPVQRSRYESESADEAWEALSQMYTRARPHTSSPEAALAYDSAATPVIAVDRVQLSAAQGAFSESPGQLNIISVLSGSISLDFGRYGGAANLPGDSYLYLPEHPADLVWDTFSALAVRMPLDLVARSAGELTGLDPDALRFTSLRPLSAAHRRLWLAAAEMLWEELSAPQSLAGYPLVHQQLLNYAAAAAVSVFPSTAMTRGYVPGPGDVRPAAVRRAVAYIDACASLPITTADIAESAGTSPRALRSAFQRHLDTTPAAYLRRVRLEGAHRDLRAADPASGATVAATAARWGFASPSRFAARYRQAYGVSPEATLGS